jgi:hypothetical protein
MQHPIALLVTGQEDGRLLARLIAESYEEVDGDLRSCGLGLCETVLLETELVQFQEGDRHIVRQPRKSGMGLPSVQSGAILLASDCVGWPGSRTGEVTVFLYQDVQVLAHGCTEDDAVDTLMREIGIRESLRNILPRQLAIMGQLDYEVAAEEASREPDEALILAWIQEDGSLDTHVVTHRGSHMFWMTDGGMTCMDTGIVEPKGPGLWLLAQGRAWSSHDQGTGEFDNGLDGSLAPVSVAQAASHFGMDEAALLEALCEAYPFIIEGPLLEVVHLPAGEVLPSPPAM